MKKKLLLLCTAAILSVGLGLVSQSPTENSNIINAFESIDTSNALVQQQVISKAETPVEITRLYRNDKLIGIVRDEASLEKMFDVVYEQEYANDFPGSKLGFIDSIVKQKMLSYNVYENKDDAIFQYIHSEKLFAIETNKVSFSNGAVIYVKNLDDFEKAREAFIRNFVSSEAAYINLKENKPLDPLWGYGEREIDLKVKESLTFTKGLASADKILKDENEVLQFLSYGYEPKVETVEVKKFDTVDGIAWANGLTGPQLVSINRSQLKSREQLLEEGMTLSVSKFSSPFTVEVTKERKVQEVIYPEEPLYQEDPTLKEGSEVVDVVAENGLRDVTYQDIYVNTESLVSTEKATKTIKEPVRSKVRFGTKIEPRVGSGNFRIPVSNPLITCQYGNSCYTGHNGTDFVYNGNGGFGPIYASDRGVVVESTYKYDWGNYVHIDHGNGYATRYAHMNALGTVSVGDVVAAGQQIGYIGATGRVTGPHLHFEIYKNGTRIDPCSMMGC